MSYFEVLKEIWKPPVGSIWKIPNYIWNTGFATNKSKDDIHPAIVEKLFKDNLHARIVPGTSKDYNKGKCVYEVDFSNQGKISYFLIRLSMPILIDDFNNLKRGWDRIEDLNEEQLSEFKRQVKICRKKG